MIDWKEFLEKKGAMVDWEDCYKVLEYKLFVEVNPEFTPMKPKHSIMVKDLEKFFVGEVARIEKEISQNRKEVNKTNSVIAKTLLDYDYVILVGRINLLKELAGVEQ